MEQAHDLVDEIIDLEEFAKAGKVPPLRCKGYRIRIDKQSYTVTRSAMTGQELLELAGKNPPERYRIDQKFCGGRTQKIELKEKVDFTTPGVERFMTLPLDQTEGYSLRRQFQLPEADEEYLNASGLPWETVVEGGTRRLIVLGFPIPTGYNHSSVDLNIRIEPGYPDVQLDTVYFHPALALVSGHSIAAVTNDNFDSKVWQRWSRHRTTANPWVPGVDYIGTHLGLVEHWLEREVAKR